MRIHYIGVIALVACTTEQTAIEPYIDNSKADGSAKLTFVERNRVDVEEPSDLVAVDGKLYTVSDRHSKIYKITPDGDARTELDIAAQDLEALAFDHERGEFMIGDESSGKIWYIDATGSRYDSIELDAGDGNSGIEGLVVKPNGHTFVAKEKDPARIFELDADGDPLYEMTADFEDISAISFNARDNRIYVLSDQEQSLFRLDNNWNVDRAWRLPMDQPEGVAFDREFVYIVSDSESRLYTFELD